jgi:D-arabinose 1-dehydrogenase-like Zn-dependent alcohol dehydrogenase
MKIAVLSGPQRFDIAEVPPPDIAPDEVLVRVRACGVCTSDLAAWRGDEPAEYPRYLGHEVSGTVAATGAEVDSLAPGDPVGVWVTSHGFAEYVAVKAAYCRPAGGVPLDEALAEPLACAVNAVEEADVRLATTWCSSAPGSWATSFRRWCACAGSGTSWWPTPGRTRWSGRRRWGPRTWSTSGPDRSRRWCPH